MVQMLIGNDNIERSPEPGVEAIIHTNYFTLEP
jgi:hypothetical protein